MELRRWDFLSAARVALRRFAGGLVMGAALSLPALAQTDKPETEGAQRPAIAAPSIVGGTPVSDRNWQQNFRWVVALVDATDGSQFAADR